MENLIRNQRKYIAPLWVANWMYFLKVKFGSTITDGRGSIAGVTYSRNHYGAYLRARTTPINPNSTGQQAVRSALAQLSTKWSTTLTAVQRTAWELYASNVAMLDKMGATMYLTGYNHYIRSNVEYQRIFGASIDDGPVIFELPGQDGTFAITASEATQFITVVHDTLMPWAAENGAAMLMYQGVPQNAQRNFFGGPWEYFANIPGILGAPAGSPSDHAAVKVMTEGQHQWCYARIIRADGRLSEPFRADTFCAA